MSGSDVRVYIRLNVAHELYSRMNSCNKQWHVRLRSGGLTLDANEQKKSAATRSEPDTKGWWLF